jgi:hypothetical protein
MVLHHLCWVFVEQASCLFLLDKKIFYQQAGRLFHYQQTGRLFHYQQAGRLFHEISYTIPGHIINADCNGAANIMKKVATQLGLKKRRGG